MPLFVPWYSNPEWQPTQFIRFETAMGTSMQTARILTDVGHAYLKAMGPHESPQLLAIELISTRLAQWFNLPVLDFSIIEIDAEFDEIPLLNETFAESGPAFATRAIDAHSWGGTTAEFEKVVNCQDVARLVVFDTWLKNCDRYSTHLTGYRTNYDNVLLEHLSGTDSGKLRLIAMDHTHCLTCGRELNDRLHHLSSVQDESLFGLFPGFIPLVRQQALAAAIGDLEKIDSDFVRTVVDEVPDRWQISREVKRSLVQFLVHRASFVAERVHAKIAAKCWPDKLFDS